MRIGVSIAMTSWLSMALRQACPQLTQILLKFLLYGRGQAVRKGFSLPAPSRFGEGKGEPFVKGILTSQTPAGVHIEWSPPLPLKCQIDRRLKP